MISNWDNILAVSLIILIAGVTVVLIGAAVVGIVSPSDRLVPKATRPFSPFPTQVQFRDEGATQPAQGLAMEAPLPVSPPDQQIKTTVGPVTITTWDPVTITGIESGTNLYFIAKNTGSDRVTLGVPVPGEPGAIEMPETLSVQHFFGFQDKMVPLAPRGEMTIEYMIAPSSDGQGEIPFKFRIVETSEETTIVVAVSVTAATPQDLAPIAVVAGQIITNEGQPISRAEVRIFSFSGRQDWRGETDAQGNFSIAIPSTDDLMAALGTRRLPYADLDYFLTAEVAEGGFIYRDGIAPRRGETISLELKMNAGRTVIYRQLAKVETEGDYGYWWLLPTANFAQLVGVQGRHPPRIEAPGHLLSIDRDGRKRWQVTTKDDCWGLAVASDGETVAGCNESNGMVLRVAKDGTVRWKLEGGGQNRHVAFSPDESQILTGPLRLGPGRADRADLAILEAATGKIVWKYASTDEWLRAGRWSRDGQRIVAGLSGGRLIMFAEDGEKLWERQVGEFPLVLEIDDDYNVYAAGKNRELFSFDADGRLRWRYRIPDHVVTAGSNNMSADGQLIVLGTVGGWLYAFKPDGTLAWRRHLPPVAQGHNALDLTPDGEWLVTGTNGENGGWFLVYRRDGSLVWKTQFQDRRDPKTSKFPFDHNHTGVITAAVSDDGRWIAAGTGDSTIRIFERTR